MGNEGALLFRDMLFNSSRCIFKFALTSSVYHLSRELIFAITPVSDDFIALKRRLCKILRREPNNLLAVVRVSESARESEEKYIPTQFFSSTFL